jgi:hypothetical protein
MKIRFNLECTCAGVPTIVWARILVLLVVVVVYLIWALTGSPALPLPPHAL